MVLDCTSVYTALKGDSPLKIKAGHALTLSLLLLQNEIFRVHDNEFAKTNADPREISDYYRSQRFLLAFELQTALQVCALRRTAL
jgi:hypothetical protein